MRALDYLPAGSIQVWNEGVSGVVSYDWATTGNNFIGQIFTRGFEQLPADLAYAVYAIYANDAPASVTKANWKARVETVIQYLDARNIKTILVKDWHRGDGDYSSYYANYNAAVDELIAAYGLPPAFDMYTASLDNFNGAKDWYSVDNVHPVVLGHQGVAKLFANYLVTNHIVTDATAKRIIAHGDTGTIVYCTVTREADGYILDGFTGAFAASSGYPYTFLQEHSTIKGRYEVAETRTVWADGKYVVTVYEQAGTSPAPASDAVIASGEMKVENDIEVEEITREEIEGSAVLAKEATIAFIEKWVLNRLSVTVNGDGTETVRLYDNDGSTVLKTWTWDPATKTRAMAV